MTKDQIELLLKASQSISAAKILLDNGYLDYAAARAYYRHFAGTLKILIFSKFL